MNAASVTSELPKRVTVIIPVYRNAELTRRCINSCLSNIPKAQVRLIVVNDHSPEEEMAAVLQEAQSREATTVTLLNNTVNIGFVASVNRGLELVDDEDVVLLNSDVIVPSGWLNQLAQDAYSQPLIGTLTPLSNHSTISSVPYMDIDNKYLLQSDVNSINRLIVGDLPLVEAPTGVGFCLYIKALCLAKVGCFDEEKFGMGYGEENDFCQRAIKAGFINAITPNLYCHHVGSVSFGSSVHERQVRAASVMGMLHPTYQQNVAFWIMQDPLRAARVVRNLQIFAGLDRPIVLYVSHDLGGGTEQHLQTLIDTHKQNLFPVVLRGKCAMRGSYSLVCGFNQKPIDVISDRLLLQMLSSIPFSCVHVHHLAGIGSEIKDWILSNQDRGLVVTIHDYFMIGGNPTLTDRRGCYVGPDASRSWHVINRINPKPFGEDTWRQEAAELFSASDLTIFPSRQTAELYRLVYSSIPGAVIVGHEQCAAVADENDSPSLRYFPLTIVIIGSLSREKGADFLERLARQAVTVYGDQVKFKLIGCSYRRLQHVQASGPYKHDQLPRLIEALKADCILFTSRCPETYSYTLSAAMHTGLPIIAPAIGAFPERLHGYKPHLLYSINDSVEILLEAIIAYLGPRHVPPLRIPLNDFYVNEYLAILDQWEPLPLQIDSNSLHGLLAMAERYCGPRKACKRLVVRILYLLYLRTPLRRLRSFVPSRIAAKIKRTASLVL